MCVLPGTKMATPLSLAPVRLLFRLLVLIMFWHMIVGWIDDMAAAIATMPGNLPQLTQDQFLGSMGNGEAWHSQSWVETQLQKRGLQDIRVNAIPKHMATSTARELLPPLAPIMGHIPAAFWTEEQRENQGANLASAVSSYLETKYGADQFIPMDWAAVVATARKPVENVL